jgi:hypothetical protein
VIEADVHVRSVIIREAVTGPLIANRGPQCFQHLRAQALLAGLAARGPAGRSQGVSNRARTTRVTGGMRGGAAKAARTPAQAWPAADQVGGRPAGQSPRGGRGCGHVRVAPWPGPRPAAGPDPPETRP